MFRSFVAHQKPQAARFFSATSRRLHTFHGIKQTSYFARVRGQNSHRLFVCFTRSFSSSNSKPPPQEGEEDDVIVEENEHNDLGEEEEEDQEDAEVHESNGGSGHVIYRDQEGNVLPVTGGLEPLQRTIQFREVIVIPHKRPLFPGMVNLINISSSLEIKEIQNLMKKSYPHVGVFMLKQDAPDSKEDEPGVVTFTASGSGHIKVEDIHEVGTLSHVREVQHLPGDSSKLQMHLMCTGFKRIRVIGTSKEIPLVVRIEDVKSIEPTDQKERDQVKAYSQEIMMTIKELLNHDHLLREQLNVMEMTDFQNPGFLADVSSALCPNAEPSELQEIMDTFNILMRLDKALRLLKKEVEFAKLRSKIKKNLDQNVNEQQRRYFLMEQLKLIKKELGIEKDEKVTIVDKFKDRLTDKVVPEEVQVVIDEEIEKLSSLEPQSSEYAVTRNYLDWLSQMPWGVYSEESFDIENAEKILNEDHYGLADVKDRILEFIAVGKLRGAVPQGKIICLVGPPGTGKTSIGTSIARALGREFYRFSVGGMTDIAEIKGHRRTYVGAMPGKLIQCLKLTKTQNPVVLIDELDKIGIGHRGDPSSSLLEVLDPKQNVNFADHYLDVPMDLSKVLFICTANDDSTIPGPLADRMEFIRISGYIGSEKMQIAHNYLAPEALTECGLTEDKVKIHDDALDALIRWYCREAGVRNLQKHIQRIYRKAALKTVRGSEDHIEIHEDNLEDFVGKRVFTSTRVYDRTPVGVVMGLAWTSLGGSTLYIETAAVEKGEGKGGVKHTGHMGEVMAESTTIAHSFAKHFLLQTDEEDAKFFEETKLHLHVPEGGIPKDGPSAGVTMVTSMLSTAMKEPVREDLAMTGEITLTGKVLPIGGVKEKTIAARREGVKCLIFPSGNKKDYEELIDEVKEGFEVHFVDDYHEIFDISFPQVKGKLTQTSENQDGN